MNFAKQQLLADNWQQIIEVSQRYQAEQVFTLYQEQVGKLCDACSIGWLI